MKNSIQINEKDLSILKAKELISTLIDNQIQSYSLRKLSDWERGQATTIDEGNDQISHLIQKKKEILNSLESAENENLVDIDFSIDLSFRKAENAELISK